MPVSSIYYLAPITSELQLIAPCAGSEDDDGGGGDIRGVLAALPQLLHHRQHLPGDQLLGVHTGADTSKA